MATTHEKAALVDAEAAKARKFERSMKFMKKAVLESQLILLDGVDTDEQLHAAGKILAQSEYSDIVEERYISKICGYTRCANALSIENTRKGRYRISLSAKKVYDVQESRHFCSPSCLIASKEFGNKLPLRQDLVESTESLMEILALVRGSQYAARSKPVRLKEDKLLKPSTRPKNVKRGKVRPKETTNARTTSSEIIRFPVEDRGKLETVMLSTNLSTSPLDCVSANDNHVGVSCLSSGLNTKNIRTIPQNEDSNSTGSNPSNNFQSTLVMPSSSDSDVKAAGIITENLLNGRKLRPDKGSITSTSFSSTVQTKFQKLKIQERVGDQTVLPMFDYGGPSDAIEGYVPLRSRREAISHAEPRTQSKISKSASSSDVPLRVGDQEGQPPKTSARKDTVEEASNVFREEVQSSEKSSRSQRDGAKIFKEWEGLVSGSPQGGPAKICIADVDGETCFSDSVAEFSAGDSAVPSSSRLKTKDVLRNPANLKPALKKQSGVKQSVLSVAWADQNMCNAGSDIGETESKESPSSTNADETLIFEKGSEDVIGLEAKIKSTKLKEEEQPQIFLLQSSLNLAMTARLASAEAIATALTEAATSAATGEFDGSEAVAQAGISILSATHNANTARSVSLHEAQDQSGEVLESMMNSALDEDELFARASQAREEMRRSKMTRKHGEIKSEKKGSENDDVLDDFNPAANVDSHGNLDEDDSDADDDNMDDDDDDDYYDDDSEGLEGASEVGFTAPPKGFKAEVSMFGTTIMALEAWISAAAVAHIYGKEPQLEDEYLSVNGREYSRQAVIGDGVSDEILRTFTLCVSRALPEVVRALRLSVPMSTLELSLGRLIKTMSFVEALPPFGTKQWRLVVILLLDALSMQRVPRLGVHFLNNRSVLRKVLDSTGTSEAEYDVFRDVVLPSGRSPVSARSGG